MIELQQIDKIYNVKRENEFQALYHVDLKVDEGEMIAITGKSGAGKSTLLHILALIENFETGNYLIDGIRVNDYSEKKRARLRNELFGIVMQEYALIEDYSVYDNVILPIDFSKNRKNARKRVMHVLEKIGIEQLAGKKISQLSGGQKQRVAIARAIVNGPKVILADEPTGALDSKAAKDIMEIFLKLKNEGCTIVIITHDSHIASICERVVTIHDGKIIN